MSMNSLGKLSLVALVCATTFALSARASALFAPAPPAVQAQPQLLSRLSTGVVKLGSDVRMIVEVENVQNATIDSVPTVDGLRFGPIPQPSLNESISIFNGRQTRSRKLSWVIQIQPQRKGEFKIPPIRATVDGRPAETRELTLKVV